MQEVVDHAMRHGVRLYLKCINHDDFTSVKDVLTYLPPALLTQERVALLLRLNGSAVAHDWFETFDDLVGVPADAVYLSLLFDNPERSIDRASMAGATRMLGHGWTVRRAHRERGAWNQAISDDRAWVSVHMPWADEPDGHIEYNPSGTQSFVEHWQAPVVVLTLAWSGYGLDHTLADIHGLEPDDLFTDS